MATGFAYSGNPDFRGWLAAQPRYSYLLDYVGNNYENPTENINMDKLQSAYGGRANNLAYNFNLIGKLTDEFAALSNKSAVGGGGGASYDPSDLAYLDSQSDQLRRLLDSAQTALRQGLTNLDDSYNREVSSANQQRSRALEDFAVKREDTTRAKQTALGKVDANARTLSDSVRRILGFTDSDPL